MRYDLAYVQKLEAERDALTTTMAEAAREYEEQLAALKAEVARLEALLRLTQTDYDALVADAKRLKVELALLLHAVQAEHAGGRGDCSVCVAVTRARAALSGEPQ